MASVRRRPGGTPPRAGQTKRLSGLWLALWSKFRRSRIELGRDSQAAPSHSYGCTHHAHAGQHAAARRCGRVHAPRDVSARSSLCCGSRRPILGRAAGAAAFCLAGIARRQAGVALASGALRHTLAALHMSHVLLPDWLKPLAPRVCDVCHALRLQQRRSLAETPRTAHGGGGGVGLPPPRSGGGGGGSGGGSSGSDGGWWAAYMTLLARRARVRSASRPRCCTLSV